MAAQKPDEERKKRTVETPSEPPADAEVQTQQPLETNDTPASDAPPEATQKVELEEVEEIMPDAVDRAMLSALPRRIACRYYQNVKGASSQIPVCINPLLLNPGREWNLMPDCDSCVLGEEL